jgi:hypothetical protein
MAQGGVDSGEQNGSHPVPVEADPQVADRVDAAVEPMKVSGGYPSSDRSRRQADLEQLPAGNDSVLAGRQFRHPCGNWCRNWLYTANICTGSGHGSCLPAEPVPVVRRM